jgi:hypothetical protein
MRRGQADEAAEAILQGGRVAAQAGVEPGAAPRPEQQPDQQDQAGQHDTGSENLLDHDRSESPSTNAAPS